MKFIFLNLFLKIYFLTENYHKWLKRANLIQYLITNDCIEKPCKLTHTNAYIKMSNKFFNSRENGILGNLRWKLRQIFNTGIEHRMNGN